MVIIEWVPGEIWMGTQAAFFKSTAINSCVIIMYLALLVSLPLVGSLRADDDCY